MDPGVSMAYLLDIDIRHKSKLPQMPPSIPLGAKG